MRDRDNAIPYAAMRRAMGTRSAPSPYVPPRPATPPVSIAPAEPLPISIAPPAPVLATSPAMLLDLCTLPSSPGMYAAGKVLRHLGLSWKGASSMVRRYVPMHNQAAFGAGPTRLLAVDRVGVAFMVLRTHSEPAKGLHPWARQVVSQAQAAQAFGPAPKAPEPCRSPWTDQVKAAADLVEAAEARALEASASLTDALEDLTQARQSLRALLRINPKDPDDQDPRREGEGQDLHAA
jgi:hypothetical protein